MVIGGYFELELPLGKEYHNNAIRLNTGRNAFEYVLRAKKYKTVFLPYFTCDVMLESIHKLNLNYEFYHIDRSFRPIFNFSRIKKDEVLVFNNYFGICETQIKEVADNCINLIIDNAQAFFSQPISGIDTFYSPRKFFGLPDGAYLYTDTILDAEFEKDISFNRCSHLLGRIDKGAESHYKSFKKNSLSLVNQPIKQMSNLTRRLLQGIDYKSISLRRNENYTFLWNTLGEFNEIEISLNDRMIPMAYPFYSCKGRMLKQKLIENNIFVATYWPNVIEWAPKDTFEYNLANNLIAIPIDQRYGFTDIKDMLKHFKL